MGEIVEKAKSAIARVEALGEGAGQLFTEFSAPRILSAALEAEARVAAAPEPLPLAGLLVSVKDLYDEAGQRTTAASRLLAERARAKQDCPVGAAVKVAGGVPFGRTTMSELAYSGVGLNPHYGTPGNVFDAEGIPGGSTSGGALTVALGLADVALGTDTGGSVRIPAAINGLYGHKPSQDLVSMQGVHPLASSFDSCGPLARDFATMLAAVKVMSGRTGLDATPPEGSLRLAVPSGAFTGDLDPWATAHFEAAKERLAACGHELIPLDLGFLHDALPANRLLVSAEAHEVYGRDLETLEEIGDPRVLARIRISEGATPEEIATARSVRADVIARLATALSRFDALIAPTLQMHPPKIAEAEADFDRVNAAMLRNTSMLNFADACALTLPTTKTGEGRPGALMVGGAKGADARVLAVGARLDRDLNG